MVAFVQPRPGKAVDVAYYGAFKCSLRRLMDYPNLWAYARELYQTPGIAETVDLDVYKRGYYSQSALRNPLHRPRRPARRLHRTARPRCVTATRA